jgi:uncharacterized protein (UPF0335 family)
MSAPGPGHNSGAGPIAADRLKSFVERIERLNEEKATIGGDIREVFAEAKSAGYDTKMLRQVIRRRAMDSADRQEQDELLAVYARALNVDVFS